jgi:hypothetical protein
MGFTRFNPSHGPFMDTDPEAGLLAVEVALGQ